MALGAESGPLGSVGAFALIRCPAHPIATLMIPMQELELLRKGWRTRLEELVDSAQSCLFIAAPFITQPGVEIVQSRLSNGLKEQGEIRILTSLDVLSICQGTCDPFALKSLLGVVPSSTLTHLPRLHAKVYIADDHTAIITSGNLTVGGLVANFEYGIELNEPSLVRQVKNDISDYANLGSILHEEQLIAFCEASGRVREAFRRQTASIADAYRREFQDQARMAEDQLIRLRLSRGAPHTVFAKTIVYLLKRHGPLRTIEQHPLIQQIHPDLCDDSVDRVIDGQHFGKKWKHAVRNAQQRLKDARMIQLGSDGRWSLTPRGAQS